VGSELRPDGADADFESGKTAVMAGDELIGRLLAATAHDAHAELPADVALDPELVAIVRRHWTACAPVHPWLAGNVPRF
jgi:hypothetical protein